MSDQSPGVGGATANAPPWSRVIGGGRKEPTILATVAFASLSEGAANSVFATLTFPLSWAFAFLLSAAAGASRSGLIGCSTVCLNVGNSGTGLGRRTWVGNGLAGLDAGFLNPITLQLLGVGELSVLLVASVLDAPAVGDVTGVGKAR